MSSVISRSQFDNNVTLLYKWAVQSGFPLKYIVIRPRLATDTSLTGAENYVFETLPGMISRLMKESKDMPEIFDIIYEFKNTLTVRDMTLSYYSILIGENPDANHLETINQTYKDLDESMIVDPYENIQALMRDYEDFVHEIKTLYDRDVKMVRNILVIQTKLIEIYDREKELPPEEKIYATKPTISSKAVSYHPTLNGVPVEAIDGIDIFNSAKVSKYVPYIKYVDNYGKSFYKVFTGERVEDTPKYSILNIDDSYHNSIYMKIWVNYKNDVNISSATKDSFVSLVYNLNRNYLSIESHFIDGKDVTYERAQDALKSLDFGKGNEIKVKGEYEMWNIEYNESILLHMILVEEIMNVYLYVEENVKPFALKKRFDVHYRSIFTDENESKTAISKSYISNYAAVSVTLNQKLSDADKQVTLVDGSTKIFPKSTKYLEILISQAESSKILNEFVEIFKILMYFYKSNATDLTALYYDNVPQLFDNLPELLKIKKVRTESKDVGIVQLTKKKVQGKKDNAKIKRLRELAPDLFVKGYARKCQCALQPIIVTDEEMAAWKQQLVNGQQRQVMPFPKDNPQWNFVCPDDKSPYPGLKLNDELSNKNVYPYIPCCFKTDQLTADIRSTYQDYLSGVISNKEKYNPDNVKKTRKIVNPDKIGNLPTAVSAVLKKYSEDVYDIVRYGVVNGPNSLLHCICTAINDLRYLSYGWEGRENYVIGIRNAITSKTNPALLKQEMYDFTDKEIIDMLGDKNIFLDPMLFYRAVEEFFNINIYTFNYPPSSGTDEELGILDIPRFKIFHSHAIRLYRPTVCISKIGLGKDDYSQCELIVDYDAEESTVIKLFGTNMTKTCHDIMMKSFETLNLNYNPVNNLVETRANIYYHLDHLDIFKYKPISQIIDNNGKMRALTISVNKQPVTIATLPSQPENLPIDNNFSRADSNLIRQVFSNFTAVTKNKEGLIDGVWYKMLDINNAEYIPLIPNNNFEGLVAGPPNPLQRDNRDDIKRYAKLKRDINIIVQLVKWLFELSKAINPLDDEGFISKYMVFDTYVGDSANYYDLSRIPRVLPVVTSVEEAIAIMQPYNSKLFVNGKLVMYDIKFASRITKMIKDYHHVRYGLPSDPIKVIENYYTSEDDFIRERNTKILISTQEYNNWLVSLNFTHRYDKYFDVRYKLDISMGNNVTPFIYKDELGKMYIIQNVVGGSKEKALTVGSKWFSDKINLGPEPPLNNQVPVHMIYAISQSAGLVPIVDNTYESPVFISLIYYGGQFDKLTGKEQRYGAILEIL